MQALQKQNYQTVAGMLEKSMPSIKAALPRHITPERFARIALSELRTNPKLLECNPPSLMSAIVKASQVGVEIGSALGLASVVPYGREATLIISYRGLIALARRSGEILSITARVVHENDDFQLEFGLDEKLRHVPCITEDCGQITHVYAIAKLRDGGIQFDVMTIGEVEQIRKRSPAGNNGPWVTDFAEMARKTVVRRLFKYLPVSVELSDAIAADQDVPVEVDITSASSVIDGINESVAADQKLEPKPEQESEPEWPKANEDGELVDVHGIPWQERFHSSSKACTESGNWRMRRGYDGVVYNGWLKSRKDPKETPETTDRQDVETAAKDNLFPDNAPQTSSGFNSFREFDYPEIREAIENAQTVDDCDTAVDMLSAFSGPVDQSDELEQLALARKAQLRG